MMRKRKFIRPRIGGAVYILPNLLTTGNLFFGFFSIVKSMQGDFIWASAAIFLGAIFDLLDGRVAKLTHGSSEFGVQYDSLCDLVSFGLAPAFLMYQYALNSVGRIGWIVCFIFLACGALRLARFNVQSSIGKASGDFTGLPIPIAGITIACYVAFSSDLLSEDFGDFWLAKRLYSVLTHDGFSIAFLLIFAPLLAFLMVSNMRFRSHKSLKLTSIKPFRFLAILVVVVGIAAYKPDLAGLVFTTGYVMSGLVEWVLGWKKPTDEDEIFQPFETDSSIIDHKLIDPRNLEEDERMEK